jgi:hypothetical protein
LEGGGERAELGRRRKRVRTSSKAAVVAVVALATLLVGASSALADSAKFDRRNTFVVNGVQDDGSLMVHFRETGLGNTGDPVEYRLSADANAVYACQNNGGNFPSDPKKTAVSAAVSTDAEFSPDNGNVEADLSIFPPPNTALTCPGGQHPVLVSITYTNVKITDLDHGVSFNFAGTFSRTFFTI